jgi:hypothetical protein
MLTLGPPRSFKIFKIKYLTFVLPAGHLSCLQEKRILGNYVKLVFSCFHGRTLYIQGYIDTHLESINTLPDYDSGLQEKLQLFSHGYAPGDA